MDVVKLLVKLVKIESVNGNEKKICDYVFGLLKKLNFKPEKIPVDKNGYNIVVKFGEPKFYLSAHLDTVAPYFPPKIKHAHIYGRGAADAKGSAAAMIVAAIEARKEKMTDFGLIFTVGEEFDIRGALAVVKSGLKIPFVIAGEPTKLKVINKHYGHTDIKLTVRGANVRGDVEEGRVNAIDRLVDAINYIDAEVEAYKFPAGSLFNISMIKGGEAYGATPRHAEAYIDMTIPPHSNTNLLKRFKKITSKIDGIKIEQVSFLNWVDSRIPKELSFLKQEMGVSNFASDVAAFRNGVLVGPGKITESHVSNERIEIKSLRKAVEIYKQIIRNFQS